MSIANCLSVPFPLTAETAAVQSALVKKIEAHNAECDSIAEAEAALKAKPDHEWTAAETHSVGRIRDRKLESLHRESSLRKEIGDFFTQVLSVDFPAADRGANAAVEDAKRKATAHLIAGGWVESRTEIGSGVFLLPIDLSVLIRNGEVAKATLTAQAMNQTPLIEARRKNAEAIESAKARFSAVKAKALALQV